MPGACFYFMLAFSFSHVYMSYWVRRHWKKKKVPKKNNTAGVLLELFSVVALMLSHTHSQAYVLFLFPFSYAFSSSSIVNCPHTS